VLEFKLLLRRIAREPTFQIVAVVCLALGLSLNALILGLADSLLFHRPSGVENADLLKRLYSTRWVEGLGFITSVATSYPNFADLRQSLSTDAALTAYFMRDLIVSAESLDARKIHVVFVADRYFEILTVKPLRGRLLLSSEVTADSPATVALISASLASTSFGGAANALGKPLRIGRRAYIVVGVLPTGFRGLDPVPVDIWLPINAVEQLFPGPRWAENRDSAFLKIICRIRPGSSIRRVEERATLAFRQGLAQEGRADSRAHITIAPIQQDRGPNKTEEALVVFWIAGIAFLILMLACANVAQLLVARSLSLGKDLVVQLSLGASRLRLLSLVLAQSSILAVLGGVVAAIVYIFCQKIARNLFLPPGVVLGSSSLLRSFSGQVVLVLICSILCGSIPSLLWWRHSTSAIPQSVFGGNLFEVRFLRSLRRVLLGVQVALASISLIGAGLFIRSLHNLQDAKIGLDSSRVLAVTPDLGSSSPTKPEMANLYQEILMRIHQLPGIKSASLGSSAPLVSSTAISVDVPGVVLPQLSTGGPYVTAISEDFFKTLGTPLRSGRAFTREDLQQRVVIVNETMSRMLWPGQSAIGKCIRIKGQKPCWLVVGVVADIRRSSLREDPTMQYYLPLSQAPDPLVASVLLVRPSGRPESILGSVRNQVQSVVPGRPFVEVKTLQNILEPQYRPWLLGARAFSFLGVLAFIFAIVGVYSTFALTIEEEKRALALRMALGALPLTVLGELLRRNLRIVGLGIASSLVVVFIAGGLIKPFLFGLSVWNAEIILGVVLALILVSSAAVCLSGRRIQRIEPAATLRSDQSQVF
jgi:predicted permease